MERLRIIYYYVVNMNLVTFWYWVSSSRQHRSAVRSGAEGDPIRSMASLTGKGLGSSSSSCQENCCQEHRKQHDMLVYNNMIFE